MPPLLVLRHALPRRFFCLCSLSLVSSTPLGSSFWIFWIKRVEASLTVLVNSVSPTTGFTFSTSPSTAIASSSSWKFGSGGLRPMSISAGTGKQCWTPLIVTHIWYITTSWLILYLDTTYSVTGDKLDTLDLPDTPSS